MLKIISIIVALLAGVSGPTQAGGAGDDGHYANQTPYGNPETTSIRTPPPGYRLVFLQSVARHGSRSQTNDEGERRAMAVWQGAADAGQLTTAGKEFDDELEEFRAAESAVGYGRLSARGKVEWKGIGRRTAAGYRDFLVASAARGDDIEFRTTSVERTAQSAASLRTALNDAIPRLDLKRRSVDDRMLITSGSTTAGRTAIAGIKRRSDVRTAARHVLRRLYTAQYVDSLREPVAHALDVYALYAIAPAMAMETEVTFSRYVAPADARVLGYVKDAEKFYRYGPGVRGQADSYRKARPVLEDFFDELAERLAGGDNAAVFRLAHGETTIPFAVLNKLPGSTEQASLVAPYSYANNSWRGQVAGRMAGNIEWAAYRGPGGKVLVTIRHNERPVRLHGSCTSSPADPYFYTVTALKRCLL